MSESIVRPPRMGAVAWRLGVASAVACVIVAAGLAIAGVVSAGEGGDLLASLIPAILTIGLGMAVPPFLFGMLGLAAAQRPPRRLRRELIALAIGTTIGALISPVLFYANTPAFGLLVAGLVAAATLTTFCIVLARLWRGRTSRPESS
ncbi:hypothetical protein [Salinibacterium sp. ZJ77]|uniref:hypothetical protein n=1 Tax=Salinibacterium sp. ZJ77 TaxID=2708337 RepID=UPI00141D967A|nr:hypothetical protein [Salinibacterium sp. ZJ77]